MLSGRTTHGKQAVGQWQACGPAAARARAQHPTCDTGASMSIRPAWASCHSATAVKNLVFEPAGQRELSS